MMLSSSKLNSSRGVSVPWRPSLNMLHDDMLVAGAVFVPASTPSGCWVLGASSTSDTSSSEVSATTPGALLPRCSMVLRRNMSMSVPVVTSAAWSALNNALWLAAASTASAMVRAGWKCMSGSCMPFSLSHIGQKAVSGSSKSMSNVSEAAG